MPLRRNNYHSQDISSHPFRDPNVAVPLRFSGPRPPPPSYDEAVASVARERSQDDHRMCPPQLNPPIINRPVQRRMLRVRVPSPRPFRDDLYYHNTRSFSPPELPRPSHHPLMSSHSSRHPYFSGPSEDDEVQIHRTYTPPPWQSHPPTQFYCHACQRVYHSQPSNDPMCSMCGGSHVELIESHTQMMELVGSARAPRMRRVRPFSFDPFHERIPQMPPPIPMRIFRRTFEAGPTIEHMLAGLMADGDVPEEAREFFEQLLRRQVMCSPTPTHVIAALPTFERLTAQHLSSNPLLSNPCAVCWDGLEGEEEERACGAVMVLPCKHGFHRDCLVPWLQNARTCPQCRANVVREAGDQ